jgi:hypothetical protein
MRISGNIKDASGDPIMGANIYVNTLNGIFGESSDFDGDFILDIGDKTITSPITISYIGYKTKQFQPNQLQNASIILEDDVESLDEIVIIGNKKQNSNELIEKPKTMKAVQKNKVIGYASLGLGFIAIAYILIKIEK